MDPNAILDFKDTFLKKKNFLFCHVFSTPSLNYFKKYFWKAPLQLTKFCPCLNNPQQKRQNINFQKFSPGSLLKVASKSKERLMQHLQSAALRQELTHGLCKAKDLLVVGVRFIPDEGVGEVGEGWERLLELPAHDGHHQVDLHQAKREPILGQQHLQDGLVASCPGA